MRRRQRHQLQLADLGCALAPLPVCERAVAMGLVFGLRILDDTKLDPPANRVACQWVLFHWGQADARAAELTGTTRHWRSNSRTALIG